VRAGARIWHGGRELEVELISGEPAPGERIEGPAICALADATLLVTPGWGGHVREDGTIELVRA
jgi:N-methylhydantoinase A